LNIRFTRDQAGVSEVAVFIDGRHHVFKRAALSFYVGFPFFHLAFLVLFGFVTPLLFLLFY
jgi:hypothetical protein